MTDLLFPFTGRELAPLLEQLLATNAAGLAAHDAKLLTFTAAQRAAVTAPPSLGMQMHYDEKGNLVPLPPKSPSEAAQVQRTRNDAYVALRETELWLIQCLRTPRTRWQLTLNDLAHLYPAQTSGEILASLRARPRGLSALFGRLLGTLRAWLVPHRRALPGPSPT